MAITRDNSLPVETEGLQETIGQQGQLMILVREKETGAYHPNNIIVPLSRFILLS